MSKPTVSVVIPVYNRPTAVRRAIDSVLSQTYRHFEMVVVDDASTDGTPVAVQAVSEPRVRLVRHETRLGGSAARNTGIRAGSAPFVAFLDSDDEWLPAKLERQLELFSKGGDRLGLVYTGTLQVTGSGARREVIPARHHNMARELLTRNVIGETSVGMVRRTVLDEVGVFDESLPSSQDLDLWLRIANRFETDFVPEALVRTTKLNVGERISSNPNAVIEGQDLFCRKHRRELEQQGLLHVYLRQAGWARQRWIRRPQAARQSYLASIRAKPLAPQAYVLLFGALIPLSWQDAAARCFRLMSPER